jgi:hypothetical protein
MAKARLSLVSTFKTKGVNLRDSSMQAKEHRGKSDLRIITRNTFLAWYLE